MKKILLSLILMFSLSAIAQPGNIDTAKANLTMKVNDWCYFISYYNGSTDSTDISFVRTVRNTILAVPNVQMNTNVTIPNLNGRYIVMIYDIARRIPAGEGSEVGNAPVVAIRAISNPVIQYFIGSIDSQYSTEHRRHVRIGKNMVIDN